MGYLMYESNGSWMILCNEYAHWICWKPIDNLLTPPGQFLCVSGLAEGGSPGRSIDNLKK